MKDFKDNKLRKKLKKNKLSDKQKSIIKKIIIFLILAIIILGVVVIINKARILNTGILLDNIKEANQIDDNNNYIYSNIERYKIILKNNKIFFKEYVIEDHKKILLRKFHSFLSTKLKIHIDELMSIVPSYKKSKKKTNQ